MDQPYNASDDIVVVPTHIALPFGNLAINAFVLRSAEPVLFDTGLAMESPQFIEALESVIPLDELRWIWLTHDDADHTGSIGRILELAPNARLATHAFSAFRMSTWWEVPFHRVRAITLDDRLHLGDRTLRAVRPPTFDNPTSIGALDESTGSFFSADAFGAILPGLANEASDVDEEALTNGMLMWGTSDSPWVHLVDTSRFDEVMEEVRKLKPSRILSSHLPAATRNIDQLIEIARGLPTAPPDVPPDQQTFEQILASMAPSA